MSGRGRRRAMGLAAVAWRWAALAGAQTVEYDHPDALGSVRVVTNEAGAVVRRHDYLPFGQAWAATPGETSPKMFTGQERDAETGLDYFGARYYRAEIGRFTTVDPGHVGGDVGNPQTWNAYVYAGNNPLRNIDPDGRRWFTKNGNARWVRPRRGRQLHVAGRGVGGARSGELRRHGR